MLDIQDTSWAAYSLWAPSVIHANGKYYLLFGANDIQSDDETGGIGVAVSGSPTGPFERIGKILQQDPEVATGAGHHSVIHIPGTDDFYIVYHRRPLHTTEGNHREVCIDRMYFNQDGTIKPVEITFKGVKGRRTSREPDAIKATIK